MSEQNSTEARAHYTRAELELELGRLTLGLERLQAAYRRRRRRPDAWPEAAVSEFLEASGRLLERTPADQRGMLVQRLCQIAAAAELGIIGLEAWFETNVPARATSDRHMAVNMTWTSRAGNLSSRGRM